jgi:hypothetical protein
MGALAAFLSIFGKVVGVLPIAIQAAETIHGLVAPGVKGGPTKLQGVKTAISQAINVTDLVAGKQIVDQAAFDAGLEAVINGGVAIMNACKPKA